MFGGLTDSLLSAAPSSVLTKMSSSSGGPSEDFLAGFLDVTVLAGGRSFLSRAAASRSALARFAAPVNLVMGVPRLKRGMIRRPSRAHSAQLLVPPILKNRKKCCFNCILIGHRSLDFCHFGTKNYCGGTSCFKTEISFALFPISFKNRFFRV